jgi:hypothetical protein
VVPHRTRTLECGTALSNVVPFCACGRSSSDDKRGGARGGCERRRAGGFCGAAGGTCIMPNMDAPDAAVCASALSHSGGAATPSCAQAAAVKSWLRGASEPTMQSAAGGCEEARGGKERVRGESEPVCFFVGAQKRS